MQKSAEKHKKANKKAINGFELMQKDLLKYPRRVFRRKIIRKFGRFVIRLLTDFSIEGEENFPKHGPYIMAGNHVAAMEVILMALFSPHQVEILGAGDIPLDPNLAPFANLHGFIPINRGSVDQTALNQAVNVLNKGGVVGIFPEGGIWSRNIKQAKIGVSWISQRSKAPVLPIGFIGMQGSLTEMLRFKKPSVKLRVGNILSFDFLFNDLSEKSKKEQLQDAADKIMGAIKILLPPENGQLETGADGVSLEPLWYQYFCNNKKFEFEFEHKDALSMVLRHPVIMDVFTRNLKLPMRALSGFNKKVNQSSMILSISAICDYLNENPGFLIYRFGTDLGRSMESGLRNYLVELT
jgi:1-acyl-sn-glycerol-3-phosphate acyltransferase